MIQKEAAHGACACVLRSHDVTQPCRRQAPGRKEAARLSALRSRLRARPQAEVDGGTQHRQHAQHGQQRFALLPLAQGGVVGHPKGGQGGEGEEVEGHDVDEPAGAAHRKAGGGGEGMDARCRRRAGAQLPPALHPARALPTHAHTCLTP